MKIMHWVLLHLGAIAAVVYACCTTPKINEFYVTDDDDDDADDRVELCGPPGEELTAVLVEVDGENAGAGVRQFKEFTQTFDDDGLMVVSMDSAISDPSLTLVLAETYDNNITDIDMDLDGDLADEGLSPFGTILDAIGVPDDPADADTIYGAALGGTDMARNDFSNTHLIFRSGIGGDLYSVDRDEVFLDAEGNAVDNTSFTPALEAFSDPEDLFSFGSPNPVDAEGTGTGCPDEDKDKCDITLFNFFWKIFVCLFSKIFHL